MIKMTSSQQRMYLIMIVVITFIVSGCTNLQSQQAAQEAKQPPIKTEVVKPEMKLHKNLSIKGRIDSNVSFSKDGNSIAIYAGDSIGIWDIQDGIKKRELSPSNDDRGPRRISFSPDNSLLAVSTGGYGSTNIIQLNTSSQPIILGDRGISTYGSYGMDTFAHGFDPTGKYLAYAHDDNQVTFIKSDTKEFISLYKWTNQEQICQLLFSPNGRYVVTSARDNNTQCAVSNLYVSKIESYPTPLIFKFENDFYGSTTYAVFSPDSKYLTYGNRRRNSDIWEVIVHDIEKNTERSIKGRPHQEIRSLAYFPNGKFLAVAHESGIIDILDTTSFQTVYSKECGSEGGLTVSNDGHYLAAISMENSVRVWDISSFK